MNADKPAHAYTVADPTSEQLSEAMWRMRYQPESLTSGDRYAVLSAAESYVHLTTYRGTGNMIRKLREIRRAAQSTAGETKP